MQEHHSLRHITKKDYLKSIISTGALTAEYVTRSRDEGYISFESNPPSTKLVEIFHLLKDWEKPDVFELLFDADKLQQDDYIISTTINRINYTNEEIDLVMNANGLDKISHEIGHYVFIGDRVPLKYLISESTESLMQWNEKNLY